MSILFFSQLLIVCWAAFLLVWAVSAVNAKKNIRRGFGWGPLGLAIRLGILLAILALVHWNIVHPSIYTSVGVINPVVGALGVALCAAGIAFAIWARVTLGKNWGMPMSQKEQPELVTAGPYAYVRHPIYTGMIVAILGSALVSSGLWYFIWLIVCVGFTWSALKEEAFLSKQFPDTYPAYKKRTKMLIPWVL